MSAILDPLPAKARNYIGVTTLVGGAVVCMALAHWESQDLVKFASFLLVAILSCGMRIRVPGITGTLSLTFMFVLFGIVELTPPETILLGMLVTLIQCYWNRPARPRSAQVIFNVSSMALAIWTTEAVYHAPALTQVDAAIRLAAATC